MALSNNDVLYSRALRFLSKLPGFQKSSLEARFGNVKADCIPCLYDKNGVYVYDCYERGIRIAHRMTANINEALYWVYRDIIEEIGFSYELNHREPLQDSRRIAFKKIDELFSVIGEPYHSMWEKDFESLITVAPFHDEINKVLFLADEYEKMVKDLDGLIQDMSRVAQKAAQSIQNKHFRNPIGGMKNPLQSVVQMRDAILIIRDNLMNNHATLSPVALAFMNNVCSTEKIASQINGLARQI